MEQQCRRLKPALLWRIRCNAALKRRSTRTRAGVH